MHRQDDRTTIQIRWLGKTRRWAIGCLVAGLFYAALAWIQERRGHPSFLPLLLLFACNMIYLAARCFFNSTFITLTRDGVEVDERPLKMCGPAQSLSFVDEEGLPVEFVVERNVKTRYGAPKIFTVSTSWMAINSSWQPCDCHYCLEETRDSAHCAGNWTIPTAEDGRSSPCRRRRHSLTLEM